MSAYPSYAQGQNPFLKKDNANVTGVDIRPNSPRNTRAGRERSPRRSSANANAGVEMGSSSSSSSSAAAANVSRNSSGAGAGINSPQGQPQLQPLAGFDRSASNQSEPEQQQQAQAQGQKEARRAYCDRFEVGTKVRIKGVQKKPELNGLFGLIAAAPANANIA